MKQKAMKQSTRIKLDNESVTPGSDVIELWCLRMLVQHGGHRKFVTKDSFSSDEVLSALSLEEYSEKDIDRPAFMKLLKEKHASAEKAAHTLPSNLQENIAVVQEQLSLNDVEASILAFTIMLHTEEALEECTDTLGQLDKNKLTRALSTVLDYPQQKVASALAVKGQLALSGLIKLDQNWTRDMKSKLDLMSGLVDNLMSPRVDPGSLFSNCYFEGFPPKLNRDDFMHLKDHYEMVKSYLERALSGRTEGVNILIHGLPGSGKSEMVRSIVHEMDSQLYEISMEDSDGDALRSSERFSAYQLSQQILKRTEQAVVLFDEIEDVFPDEGRDAGQAYSSTSKKAWINRLLETNPVPALWLSNKVHHIDPAFLRRFDYVLEMPTPNKNGRKRILGHYLEDITVSDQWIEKVSEHEYLLPAHIEKATKVAGLINHNDATANEKELERVLNGMMKVLGRPKIRENTRAKASISYSLDYLNTNVDMNKLVEGLKRSQKGNLCFYGAPGTGKTALAGYIARQLGKPLLSKRASDILGMYVGQSEQNIARMFEQARQEDAVLVLDEADSLLRDRRGADHSWEVTQVNELLVQMENFDGLFICSTNLMDDLDQASLRRFAIKVEFDYLKPEQAVNMLQQECIGEITEKDRQTISMMSNLAPGDFSAVKKRLELLGQEATPHNLIQELKVEVAIKEHQLSNPIGFLN